LEGSTVRVLVVDDYEPFRRFVCATLGKRQDTQVIGEASDGLEAVRKAQELQPDLIVLDIGLPALNGIEAGRRIRKLCPDCKIFFMSQESSADVAQEAFSLGAMGYVIKANAGSELLAAVEAVCQGRYFVGKGLSGPNLITATEAQASGHSFNQELLRSFGPRKAESPHSHEVRFYSDDAAFLNNLTCFVEDTLKAGNPVIVVATESHRKSLFQMLLARGVDGAAAIEQGFYLPVDVDEMIRRFMVNDLPDSGRFLKLVGDLLALATKAAKVKHPRVAAFGEVAPTLWSQGKVDAAIQVEHLTDEVARTCNVDILCGYVLTSSEREPESYIYERICAEHSAVLS
jgi:DNA-binding NarL/FixJ family response regulator